MTELERGILLDCLWYLAILGGLASLVWLLFERWFRGEK